MTDTHDHWASKSHNVICDDCDYVTGSDWLSKANSDADWHETATGHATRVDGELYDDEGNAR